MTDSAAGPARDRAAPGGPLLFLDVDGPLIPFGATPQQLPGGYPTFPVGSGAPDAAANPLLTRLDPALGPLLAALPCELVWATTWMDEANACVAPRLGLPHLAVLDDLPVLGELPEQEPAAVGPGRRAPHWKVPAMVAWAAGRPFVWVDDEVSGTDRAWVAAHHPGRTLLHHVDARVGLTARDFTVLDGWLRAH